MIGVRVRKSSKMGAYKRVQELNWDKELQAQANKTLNRARTLAPVLTGNLKFNGRTRRIKNGVRVQFGDSRVPYARKRHFENRKNPQTIEYLARAGDSVKKDGLIVVKKEHR